MALKWPPNDQTELEAHVERCPPDSGRCEELVRAVLPIARRHDEGSHALEVRPYPLPARFVVPKHPLRRSWSTHFLTGTREHGVDALTGPPGEPTTSYLNAHWQHPKFLRLAPTELGNDVAGETEGDEP